MTMRNSVGALQTLFAGSFRSWLKLYRLVTVVHSAFRLPARFSPLSAMFLQDVPPLLSSDSSKLTSNPVKLLEFGVVTWTAFETKQVIGPRHRDPSLTSVLGAWGKSCALLYVLAAVNSRLSSTPARYLHEAHCGGRSSRHPQFLRCLTCFY